MGFPELLAWALFLGLLTFVTVRLLAAFGVRFAARAVLSGVGRRALDRLPDSLGLRRDPGAGLRDPAAMERLAGPLKRSGFTDCGVWVTSEVPGLRIWFLIHEGTRTGAFVYDQPGAPFYVELSTRYEDGTTTVLSSRVARAGEDPPPFFRRLQGDPSMPSDLLYAKMLAERSPSGIKPVTAATVVDEFEVAYARLIAYKKDRGISPEQVAAIGREWLERRRREGRL